MANPSQILKKARKEKGITQSVMSDKLGMTLRQYQKIEDGAFPKFKREIVSKIDEILGTNIYGIIYEQNVPQETQAQEVEQPYHKKRLDIKNAAIDKKSIPFYDAPAAAGITETEMTAIHAPAGTIDIGDLLSDSQAAIRIYGNSMLPNYPPGCVVGLAKCNKSFIEPGEVYVIETQDRRLLKRLFYKADNSDGDWITCYSDNIMKFEGGARDGRLAYPPFDIPKTEIINLFVVTGVIKRNANSVIINR